MNVTLVENAQHNINRRQRGKDQERLTGQRCLKRLDCSGEIPMDSSRHSDLLFHFLNGCDRIAESNAAREVERKGHRRKLSLVIDRNGRGSRLVVRDRVQRNDRAVGRAEVNRIQSFGALPELRIHFHDDVILVQRGVHG